MGRKEEMSITVYTKPACVQCTQTKKSLDKMGLEYETKDVTTDEEAYETVVSLGYKAAPVIVAGSVHWSGFQPDKLNALIS